MTGERTTVARIVKAGMPQWWGRGVRRNQRGAVVGEGGRPVVVGHPKESRVTKLLAALPVLGRNDPLAAETARRAPHRTTLHPYRNDPQRGTLT